MKKLDLNLFPKKQQSAELDWLFSVSFLLFCLDEARSNFCWTYWIWCLEAGFKEEYNIFFSLLFFSCIFTFPNFHLGMNWKSFDFVSLCVTSFFFLSFSKNIPSATTVSHTLSVSRTLIMKSNNILFSSVLLATEEDSSTK